MHIRLGPLEVDLFASRLTNQLQTFVSWRPDLMAMATDTFTLDWAELRAYANPPWNLIGGVLAQTRRQQAELVLMAPVWKAQGWYPTGNAIKGSTPDPQEGEPHHSLPEVVLQLAVWTISGSTTRTAKFQREPRTAPAIMEAEVLHDIFGKWVNRTVIPFHAL